MAKENREEPKMAAPAGRPTLVRAKPLEADDRFQRRPAAPSAPPSVAARGIRYLAVSREAGSGGEDVALVVAKRLGWAVYDKDRLDNVIEQLQLSGTMLDAEEPPSGWGSGVLATAADRKAPPHDKSTQLSQAILEASKHGNAVFIGRGAQFVLPRAEVLAVRIIASEKYRILQIAAHTGVAGSAAHQSIHAQDEGRREFVQKFFHHDLTDPHEFDLIINVENCGQEGAANLILAVLTGRISPAAKSAT